MQHATTQGATASTQGVDDAKSDRQLVPTLAQAAKANLLPWSGGGAAGKVAATGGMQTNERTQSIRGESNEERYECIDALQ